MIETVCHQKVLILAHYDHLKVLLSLLIFRLFKNVFSFLIKLCVCMFAWVRVYVWAAVSAGHPALLFLLIYSMSHYVSLQY